MDRFQVGDWTVDVLRGHMTRGGETVRVEPKAIQVLTALHLRAGQTVRKEELIAHVWSDVAVSDEVLTTAIYQLRRALGDDRRRPRYIETVPRVGYRIVTESLAASPAPARLRFVAAIAAAVVVAAALVFVQARLAGRSAAGELQELGRAALARGADLDTAVTVLRRAAELEPDDAAISGSLALALVLAEGSPPEQRLAAAERAIRLDPRNADALVARGLLALWEDWNWNESIAGLRMAAGQGDPVSRAWLGYALALAGEEPEARASVAGIAAPPLAAITASTSLLLLGDVDASERILTAAMRHDPTNEALQRQLVKVRDRRLELAGAVSSMGSPVKRPTDLARFHLLRGDADQALASLERAWRERDGNLLYLRVDRRWDPLRHDGRFQAIAAAVGP